MPGDETLQHQQALEVRWLIGRVAALFHAVFPTPTRMRRVAGQQDGTFGGPKEIYRAARRMARHTDRKGRAVAENIHNIADDYSFVIVIPAKRPFLQFRLALEQLVRGASNK